ncbi:hypothetical protein pb186bvf_011649 [Paramecium bursaria]
MFLIPIIVSGLKFLKLSQSQNGSFNSLLGLLLTNDINYQQQMQEKNIENYEIGNTIGEGTFGKVKIGKHKLTGERVAIKILEKDKIQDESDITRIAKEIEILKKLRHPNIILLYEIIESEKELFLIMEYAPGGELFEFIVKSQRIKEQQACKFLLQILDGVDYMHKIGIVHRDLKPENLLLDQNQFIKIVDFGLSNTYKQNEFLKTACGSPCYAAPEMIQGKKYQGYFVDIWSCGIILFAMVCGYLPFEDQNTNELYKKIIACDISIPKHVSVECKDLLLKILNTDPTKRYNIQQIKNHKWCKQIKHEDYKGIVVGSDTIEVDEIVIEQLRQYNVDISQCRKYIQKNRHNQLTTLYYLQLAKYKRSNKNKTYFKQKEESPDVSQIIVAKEITPERPKTSQSPNQKLTVVQESPKVQYVPLKREVVRYKPVQKPLIPRIHFKPIDKAVNNSISSVGTNTNTQSPHSVTPIATNRKTEESTSLDRQKQPTVVRAKAISVTMPSQNVRPILKIHKGAFNLSSASQKHPDQLIEEIKNALNQCGIRFQQKGKYEIQCQGYSNIRYELSIRQIQSCDNWNLLRSKLLVGDFAIYQQIIQRMMMLINF